MLASWVHLNNSLSKTKKIEEICLRDVFISASSTNSVSVDKSYIEFTVSIIADAYNFQ